MPKSRPAKKKEPKSVIMAPVRPDLVDTEELAESLSEEVQSDIVRRIIGDYETVLQDRGEWESRRDENYRRWRQMKDPKDFPWEDASNLMLPLTTAGVETYHPRLYDSLLGIPDPVQPQAMESKDQPNEDRVSKFLNWQVLGPMQAEEYWDLFIQIGEIEGTAVAKTHWKKKSKIIKDKVPIYEVDPVNGGPLLDHKNQPVPQLDGEGKIKMRTVLKEDVEYEAPFFDIPDQADIIVPWNARDCQTADFVMQRLWMKPDVLRRRGRSGKFVNVEDAIAASRNASHSMEVMNRGTTTRNKAQGTSPIAHTWSDRDPVLVLEVYYSYDVDGDGFEEECIFWVGVHSRKLLRGKYLNDVVKHGRRPFTEWRFMVDPHRFYGIGIPEMICNVQDEIDAVHNQRIDAGTIANIPFGFYRPASGYDPENVVLAPGTWIPVDDINDVKFGQYPDVKPSSFQEEALLIDYYERLLGVNDNLQGRPSSIIGTRATARGQSQLLEQSLTRINMVARRLRRSWDEFIWQVHQLDMQYLPPGVEFRVTNDETGEAYFEHIRERQEIKGRFDFRQRADVEVKTSASRREEAQLLLNIGVSHPLLAQDVDAQAEILVEFFKSFKKPQLVKIVKRIQNSARQIPDAMPPEEEIGMMIQGTPVEPRQDEDLLHHARVHSAFMSKPEFKSKPKRIQLLLESHLLKTLFLYRNAASAPEAGGGESLPVNEAQNRLATFGAPAGFDGALAV